MAPTLIYSFLREKYSWSYKSEDFLLPCSLLYKKFESHIYMFQKILKINVERVNDISHERVRYQLQIRCIFELHKNHKSVDLSMHIFKSLNPIRFVIFV